MTSTISPPVKGMVFKHATRTNYDGSPVEATVTSVMHGTVCWAHPLYSGGKRFKTPLSFWERFCAEVVSVPENKPFVAQPKMSDAQYSAFIEKAHQAGMAAGEVVQTATMVVGVPTTPLSSDIDPSKKVYMVPDGICGFAYLNTAGNTPFGRYCKRLGWRPAFRGGLFTSVRPFGQSLERKTAYAQAWVASMQESGVSVSYETRVD